MVSHPARLKVHRSTEEGLVDLLNYAAVVEDGVIVGKNGALMAAWVYTGSDHASSSEAERERVSLRINEALAPLGSGWMIHVDAIRRPAPAYPAKERSHFPDRVTAAIDEERRRWFEQVGTLYEGSVVLTLTWLPPLLAEAQFVALLFDDESDVPDRKSQTRGLIRSFQRACEALENRLSTVLHLTRLKSWKSGTEEGTSVTLDDFLSHLQFCITGVHQPVVLPNCPIYLDALIGGQELWTGVIPKIGRQFIQCIALEGFPLESHPGILNALAELPLAYRWSSRFIPLDSHEALSALDAYRKKWQQKVRGFFDQVFNTGRGPIDQDALSMVADAESAMAEVNSGLVAVGYYTSVVVVMDEDRSVVEQAARQIQKLIQSLGFVARIETVNTLEAYLGSLPGHGYENVRRPLLNTLNLADLLPTSTIWTGESTAPCPFYPPDSPPLLQAITQGQAPFRLNLHVRDVGHTLIFGPIGAGKSTLLGMLAQSFLRYPGMSLFVFDKGLSMVPLAKAAGGQHYTVAGDEEALAFCPLQYLGTARDRAWAGEWIETLLALNGLSTTPTQRNGIADTLLGMKQTGERTLSAFCFLVQGPSIREALKAYTVGGPMGQLLDAEQDGLAFNRLTVFEIEDLMNCGEKYALPVLLYLFRRIERAIRGQPAAILLDEAWLMLGHPVFRDKLREWLKVMRKANCAVVLATQSLSDAARSGILDVLVESTATKIFLPNLHARDPDTSALYARMGLTPRQIEILATALPKKQYYAVSEKGRRLFDLALGPLALSFVGVSDRESVLAVRKLEAQHGEGWVAEWLKGRGLNLEDYV